MAGTLSMHPDSSLMLDGRPVLQGDRLALWVFHAWIGGEARQDRTGWYLVTTAQVCIRLTAGLTASFAQRQEETSHDHKRETGPWGTPCFPDSEGEPPPRHPGY